MCTSTAFQLPSCSGSAVEPTNDPGLMSAIEALISATTWMLSAIFTFSISPSRALTVSIDPSTCSTVPRTRTGLSCADADVTASIAAHVAPIIVHAFMVLSSRKTGMPPLSGRAPKWIVDHGGSASHRRRDPAADIDGRRRVAAVRLLLRAHDDDLRTRLDFTQLARRIGNDRRVFRDNHLFLAVLVFHNDPVSYTHLRAHE